MGTCTHLSRMEPRHARRKRDIPAYRRHKARNRGKTVFGRVTIYFPGPFRSEESRRHTAALSQNGWRRASCRGKVSRKSKAP